MTMMVTLRFNALSRHWLWRIWTKASHWFWFREHYIDGKYWIWWIRHINRAAVWWIRHEHKYTARWFVQRTETSVDWLHRIRPNCSSTDNGSSHRRNGPRLQHVRIVRIAYNYIVKSQVFLINVILNVIFAVVQRI